MSDKKAFSLLELSIVITIIAILVTGALSVSVNDINQKKIEITNARIQEIYKALGNYLAINKRLPCPASPQVAKSTSNYGTEVDCSNSSPTSAIGIWRSESSANIWYGMIPIRALGLSSDFAEDGFGSKFSFFIVKGFASNDSSTGFSTNHANTYDGNGTTNRIRIHEKFSSTVREITNQAMFAIISHGPNKSAGFFPNGTVQNSLSTDPSEYSNSVNGSLDVIIGIANLYNYDAVTNSYPLMLTDTTKSIFDDIVFYKTREEMLIDFNLYNLIPCPAQTFTNLGYNNSISTTSFAWAQGSYNEISASTNACPSNMLKGIKYPTRRCGPFGVWNSYTIEDCLQ